MTRLRARCRCAIVTLAAAGLVLVTLFAAPAYAHAEIVAATPPAGSGLVQAPGAVVLEFTEPLNRQVSAIAVLDRSGRDVAEGPTLSVHGDRKAMRRKLGLLRPGVYRVAWTTVSTLDGHALKGSYDFGIGAAPSGNESVRAGPVESEGWAGLAGQLLAFSGLGLWFGSAVLTGVAGSAGVPPRRLQSLGRCGPVFALCGTALSLGSSAYVATGSLSGLEGVVGSGSGRFQLIVLAVAALGVLVGLSRRSPSRAVSGTLAGIAIVADAASGHAAATTAPLWATLSLASHLGAVGVWMFLIVAAMLASSRIVATLRAFSPWAIGAALVVGVTGIVNALLELNSPADLSQTTYGRVLTFKVVALVAMAVIGFVQAVRRRDPQPSVRGLRELVSVELGWGALALVLAVVLVGFPNPPRAAAIADALRQSDSLQYLTSPGAVSLADGSGPFVVALTLLPARPGPVTFRVDVIGIEPGDALRDARVRGTEPDGARHSFPLGGCGPGCFQGNGTITTAGTWRFETSIASNRGAVATSATIGLPPPSGVRVLDRAITTMDHLRSVQIDEQLRSLATSPPTIARYTFAAPDLFSYVVAGGGAQVQVGRQQFTRDTPTGPWKAVPPAPGSEDPGFRWPASYFRDIWADATAVRVIGADLVDGVPCDIVAFGRPDVAAWFRLWIGTTDHRVHRMQMRADGHLMDHHYVEFNAAVNVAVPT